MVEGTKVTTSGTIPPVLPEVVPVTAGYNPNVGPNRSEPTVDFMIEISDAISFGYYQVVHFDLINQKLKNSRNVLSFRKLLQLSIFKSSLTLRIIL